METFSVFKKNDTAEGMKIFNYVLAPYNPRYAKVGKKKKKKKKKKTVK